METIQTKFTAETTLLIKGVKGKVGKDGKILDKKTEIELEEFVQNLNKWAENPAGNNVDKT